MKSSKTNLILFLVLIYSAFQCIAKSPPSDPEKPIAFKKGIHKSKYANEQVYFWYVPSKVAEDPTKAKDVVAIIHGYTGQANGSSGVNITLENLKRFTVYADSTNSILIAPHFNESVFGADYQRLNLEQERFNARGETLDVPGVRSDMRLIQLIQLLQERFPNIDDKKIKLFGFSGGGQFVHRFCAFHPNRIEKAIIGGAGWYMWPDDKIEYPLGFNLNTFSKVDKRINTKAFVQCDMLVLIGEEDKTQGSFRTELKNYDLDIVYNLNKMQGNTRVKRASKWVAALKEYAAQAGVKAEDVKVKMQTVKDVPHRTPDEFMRVAFNYLAGRKIVIFDYLEKRNRK
jgi:pimeloyl-ACP methyl ester carboxylesterase